MSTRDDTLERFPLMYADVIPATPCPPQSGGGALGEREPSATIKLDAR